MKIFLSFRYSGETRESLREFFFPIITSLRESEKEVYCFLEEEEEFETQKVQPRDMFAHVFEKLRDCDIVLCIVRGPERSEGMLMEVGFAIALRKPVVLYKQVGVSTYIGEVAEETHEFQNGLDLLNQITKSKFTA